MFTRREDVPRFARMVPLAEIEKNDYNLNLPRYIDGQTPEDVQDIAGHLRGGIPVRDVDALADYWAVCPALRSALFRDHRPGYVDLAADKAGIKAAIFGHPEFETFVAGMHAHFDAWRTTAAAALKALGPGGHPKQVIADLAEGLLRHYHGRPLIDPYAVYQHLLDYWAETMQDDCYQIAADGWTAEAVRVVETDKKGKAKDRGWACDLVPKPLIVARFFAADRAAADDLAAKLDAATAKLAELEEEHGGEDGAFAELEKVNKGNVQARLREIAGDADAADEADALTAWSTTKADEDKLKKQVAEREAALDKMAYAKYPTLSGDEVKVLVVDDMWLAALDARIHGEMDRVSQQLTARVRELAERYESTLPTLTDRVSELETKVNGHLERMGFSWT